MIVSVLHAKNIIFAILINFLLPVLINMEDMIDMGWYDQPLFQDLVNCQQFLKELSTLNVPIFNSNFVETELNFHILIAVRHNSKIVDYSNNFLIMSAQWKIIKITITIKITIKITTMWNKCKVVEVMFLFKTSWLRFMKTFFNSKEIFFISLCHNS